MAFLWALLLGRITTYGALCSKLWCINKVLQFTWRKIDILGILMVSVLAVLSLWTDLTWMQPGREETNALSGESIGECSTDHMVAFLVPLVVLMLIPTVLTGFMAWKTKDVDDAKH
jgi:hypothetical protein